ncbi:MAG: DUF3084 domain-containing protein [Armatimonadota bacterium]
MSFQGVTWRVLVVLVLFVLTGGFIAYWGDLLGRRMGKHRMSIFGLRPRYTAIFTTTVTGMLIVALSIAALWTVSERVRMLMLHGDRIISEAKMKERQLADAKADYTRASKQLSTERRTLALARMQRDQLSAEVDRITASLRTLKENLRRNEAALAVAKRDLSVSKKEILSRRKEIGKQKEVIASLEARRDSLQQVIRKLAEDVGDAIDWYPRYIALRERKITFTYGEEIARKVIEGRHPKAEVRAEVVALLEEASNLAKNLGAKVEANGRAVEIKPIKIVTEEGSRFLKEDESIDALAENISGSSGNVVVRVVSIGNSVDGESILVDMVSNYNKLIYSSGDEVTSAVFDGGKSRGSIFGDLVQFFRNDVRAAAMAKGIIPVTAEDGEPSVGRPISGDELFDLVDAIKAHGGSVRVRALAVHDTWSADSLEIRLAVGDRP